MSGTRGPRRMSGERLALRLGYLATSLTADDTSPDELLAARARELARSAPATATLPAHPFVVFVLAGESYAVPAPQVRGVFRLEHLAVLPGATPAVIGLTLWRGELLSILDLRPLLGLPLAGLDDRAWVVVVAEGARKAGVLAGTVSGVMSVSEGPELLAEPARAHGLVRGLTAEAVQLLDVAILIRRVSEGGRG